MDNARAHQSIRVELLYKLTQQLFLHLWWVCVCIDPDFYSQGLGPNQADTGRGEGNVENVGLFSGGGDSFTSPV